MDVIDLEDESSDIEILNSMVVTNEHFQTAWASSNPSVLCAKVPNVSYDDIGGLENVKRELQESKIFLQESMSLNSAYKSTRVLPSANHHINFGTKLKHQPMNSPNLVQQRITLEQANKSTVIRS